MDWDMTLVLHMCALGMVHPDRISASMDMMVSVCTCEFRMG